LSLVSNNKWQRRQGDQFFLFFTADPSDLERDIISLFPCGIPSSGSGIVFDCKVGELLQ